MKRFEFAKWMGNFSFFRRITATLLKWKGDKVIPRTKTSGKKVKFVRKRQIFLFDFYVSCSSVKSFDIWWRSHALFTYCDPDYVAVYEIMNDTLQWHKKPSRLLLSLSSKTTRGFPYRQENGNTTRAISVLMLLQRQEAKWKLLTMWKRRTHMMMPKRENFLNLRKLNYSEGEVRFPCRVSG